MFFEVSALLNSAEHSTVSGVKDDPLKDKALYEKCLEQKVKVCLYLHNQNLNLFQDKAASYRYFFPKYQYSCKRLGVVLGNVDEFYVVTFDGETIPMFMVVPCGKCTLCRDKIS